jgi:hypothetical protein
MPEHAITSDPSTPTRSAAVAAPPRTGKFLLLMIQLGLVAGVVYLFAIERRGHFFPVLCVLIGGFAVHAWLPAKYRLGFFALLSAVCVLFVLGVANGLWVLGLGGAMIGICYLPVGLWTRVVLLATAAALLVALRVQWPSAVWPVLGSMFMFRLILYVYSTRNEAGKPPWATSLSYFFLAPNVCFPLFPVVDYRTFRSSWYNADEWEIYQRGVTWIIRGIAHLLLYRYITLHLVPEAYELYDITHIGMFMATNYALYLHVSGQFHLITGVLHLFGFNLPRTHAHYFLASSFTDIWRRINIYWKDFMMKLFFFPVYYAVHGRGASIAAATVLGVMVVFVSTWLLHSWQTFWLLGRFPLRASDAALWLVAGACVAVNALLDARRARRGVRSSGGASAWGLSARTVGMFVLISLFWACWTNPDFPMLLAGAVKRPGAGRGLLVMLVWLLAAVAAGALILKLRDWRIVRGGIVPALSWREAAQLHVVGLAAVVSVASPWFADLLGPDAAHAIAEFRSDMTREDDLARLGGYYEDLNAAAIQAGPLIRSLSPADEALRAQAYGFAKVARDADPYLSVELIPGVRTELVGSPTSINRFGMRDHDSITLHKPEGTIRIAMVGSSVVMGYGVADDEVFSRVFEQRLNARFADGRRKYEVLNFGVGKQWASHRLFRIQRQVLAFDPDAIYYFAHQDELQESAKHIARLVTDGYRLPSRHVQDLIDTAGFTPEFSQGMIQTKLMQFEDGLLAAIYSTIVDECRERGILPVWIYLPIGADTHHLAERLVPLAQDAGFVVCDLSSWMEGRASGDVLAPGEQEHPHAGGHLLIAEALLNLIEQRPQTLPTNRRPER